MGYSFLSHVFMSYRYSSLKWSGPRGVMCVRVTRRFHSYGTLLGQYCNPHGSLFESELPSYVLCECNSSTSSSFLPSTPSSTFELAMYGSRTAGQVDSPSTS